MRPELPVLIKARALIADPTKWGKGASCERGWGCALCIETAIEKAALDASVLPYDAIDFLRAANGFEIDVYQWNDAPERTHAEALAAFDKAIEAAA